MKLIIDSRENSNFSKLIEQKANKMGVLNKKQAITVTNPISWNGTTSTIEDGMGGSVGGKTIDIIWGDNPYRWGDVNLAHKIYPFFGGRGTDRRRQKELNKQLTDKEKQRIIQLVSYIKGERIVQTKETSNVEIKLSDAKLIVDDIFKSISIERELEEGVVSEITSYIEEENVV